MTTTERLSNQQILVRYVGKYCRTCRHIFELCEKVAISGGKAFAADLERTAVNLDQAAQAFYRGEITFAELHEARGKVLSAALDLRGHGPDADRIIEDVQRLCAFLQRLSLPREAFYPVAEAKVRIAPLRPL